MNEKVMVVLLSVAILACTSPVMGMVSSSSTSAQTGSSCRAVPLSASEMSHYQQMQSAAQAKDLLSLRGGSGPEDPEVQSTVWIAIGVAFTVGMAFVLATA